MCGASGNWQVSENGTPGPGPSRPTLDVSHAPAPLAFMCPQCHYAIRCSHSPVPIFPAGKPYRQLLPLGFSATLPFPRPFHRRARALPQTQGVVPVQAHTILVRCHWTTDNLLRSSRGPHECDNHAPF
jgi:hypothetical protein